MTTCPKCACGHHLSWGGHYCLGELPPMPKEFDAVVDHVPVRDFYDRMAWLWMVTGRLTVALAKL